jgi:hypothetical protein
VTQEHGGSTEIGLGTPGCTPLLWYTPPDQRVFSVRSLCLCVPVVNVRHQDDRPRVFARSSKGRLTNRDLGRFPAATLFDRIARAVCGAGCLPRKELYEAWEVARRSRRLFRGGRVVDLCGGHGLLALVMLLLDDTSPDALVVDTSRPASSAALHDAIVMAWPRLAGRITYAEAGIDTVELHATDVVVSSHACGALTDVVLDRAAAARARVAVMPCCHHLRAGEPAAPTGWVDGPLAIDIRRALALERTGYQVWTQTIASDITPRNRLLLGAPAPV